MLKSLGSSKIVWGSMNTVRVGRHKGFPQIDSSDPIKRWLRNPQKTLPDFKLVECKIFIVGNAMTIHSGFTPTNHIGETEYEN